MLVLTVIGPDRPGLVEVLSRVIAGHGGNWLESRMSRLGGEFAGIIRVEIPAAAEQALAADLSGLSAQGLTVVCRSGSAGPPAAARIAALELVGLDRPGIVRDISQALARAGANVEDLTSSCESAAMSGEPLFRAAITISLPPGCDVAAIRHELEEIAAHLLVDISLEPLDAQSVAST
ncbi:MAG TPA: ACT domain-containing protein [Chthoniobacteraceae bacterium]|jgi:glycine cleavage system regulatory protein|nr:ACT domain-containing protein [Chthoniobacteraceae bacterium]